jgi:hypothetical protein
MAMAAWARPGALPSGLGKSRFRVDASARVVVVGLNVEPRDHETNRREVRPADDSDTFLAYLRVGQCWRLVRI